MTKHITLGEGITIDVARLIESRLLVQANSGGGKSWAIRRLLEQTYGTCQHIVVDVEDEFHTLRESFDYVLAGQGGDCPVDTKSAALLARRLLELNVSAIVNISELGAQRPRFVKLFLEALVNAPRELWHPVLVVVDEAHMFCPEAGQSESASAVIDLMTRGRKRGFCGVLATQRISKLHKDAAAEANNKLIGRCALDIDMKRAGAELGMTTREDLQRLRTLKAGEFGPALSDDVALVKVGPVTTTHPKAGQRAAPATPPKERIRKILGQLADLPAEAAEEARTAGELRAKVAELERLLAAKPGTAVARVETKVVERAVLKDGQLARAEKLMIAGGKLAMELLAFGQKFAGEAEQLRAAVMSTRQHAPPAPALPAPPRPAREAHVVTRSVYPGTGAAKVRELAAGSIPVGEAATLRALIQYTSGLRREQLTVLTGYKRSTRDSYIARLREKGLLEVAGDVVRATREGVQAMPDAEPLPVGAALQDYWLEKLPIGERSILTVLLADDGAEVARDVISERTTFKRSTRDSYISRLAAKELVVDVGRGMVKASPTLFEVA